MAEATEEAIQKASAIAGMFAGHRPALRLGLSPTAALGENEEDAQSSNRQHHNRRRTHWRNP